MSEDNSMKQKSTINQSPEILGLALFGLFAAAVFYKLGYEEIYSQKTIATITDLDKTKHTATATFSIPVTLECKGRLQLRYGFNENMKVGKSYKATIHPDLFSNSCLLNLRENGTNLAMPRPRRIIMRP